MARMIVHSITVNTAIAATATASTMTEVSMRRFCHVIITSPGRSASQTVAAASRPTITR